MWSWQPLLVTCIEVAKEQVPAATRRPQMPSTDAVAGVTAISSTGSAKNLLHDREYCIFRDGNLNRERGRRERVTCGNGIDCEFDRKSFASPFRFQLDSVEKETVTKVKANVVMDQWGRWPGKGQESLIVRGSGSAKPAPWTLTEVLHMVTFYNKLGEDGRGRDTDFMDSI